LGICLNANYRIWKDNKKQTVPAPVDPDTPNVDWWYDKIAKNALKYRQMGFTSIFLPPPCKTQGGHANDADGYGKFDDYDIGSKDQSYSVETRFGTADQLRRCVAICHAVGIDVYTDLVLHQYAGGRRGVYRYKSSTGKDNGRFPKHPECFAKDTTPGGVDLDSVFDPEGNYGFGDRVAYVNSVPKNYMRDGAVDASDWLIRTCDFDGMRVDDTKGSNTGFISYLLSHKSLASKFAVGECFVGNPDELYYWVWKSGMNGRASTIDFTVHWHLQNVCDNNGSAADLLNGGSAFFKKDPFHAVTYVESPDTDLSPGQQIISNKGLAYWYILTSEGFPLLYYRDLFKDPFCYGLEDVVANLMWVHEHLANGTTTPRHGDSRVACFERGGAGYPGLLTAANWDTWSKRTITVQTSFPPNTRLHDYSGHHDDVWTDGSSRCTFTLPANSYSRGQSFVCFSRPGLDRPFDVHGRSTTQTFFGDFDLDIAPASSKWLTRRKDLVWGKHRHPDQ
jgi:alpha-amylase